MLAELEYATLISRLVVGAFLPDLLTLDLRTRLSLGLDRSARKRRKARHATLERSSSRARARKAILWTAGISTWSIFWCTRTWRLRHSRASLSPPPAGLGTLGLARCVWGPFFLSSPPFPSPVGVVACTIRAGIGREEPNANPHLPEPETRVNMMGALMMGPFAIITELLGPGVRTPSPHVWLRLLAFVARIAFLNTARSRPFVRAALQEAPRPGLLLRLRCNHRDDDPASAGRRDDELPHRRRRRVIRAFGCR